MPGQSPDLIEYFAHRHHINLQNASLKDQLYVYALIFKEVDNRFRGDLIEFPPDSLEEIVEAFRSIANFFNDMQSKSMNNRIADDIKIAKALLVKARSCANAAAQIIRKVEPDSLKFYEVLPIYQEHLQNCAIHVVDINNQILSWLDRNP